jgi:hypothetical protein
MSENLPDLSVEERTCGNCRINDPQTCAEDRPRWQNDDWYCLPLHQRSACVYWSESAVSIRARAEAALAGVTKELDRATEHLRDMLNEYPEPSRCRERVRLWLAARDAEKEGK